jgi:hypothetical protein
MSSDEMGSNNEGFDENTEIWSMGDMSCGTNIEDLWDEDMWETSEKKPKKKYGLLRVWNFGASMMMMMLMMMMLK